VASEPVFTTSKKIKVGLGEAVQRLLAVEMRLMNGLAKVEKKDIAQRQLILEALNLTQLDLGFDCNEDGTPDTIDIFEQAADTSCCRVVSDTEACCRVPVDPSSKTKKAKGKSRSTEQSEKTQETPAPVKEPIIEIVTPRASVVDAPVIKGDNSPAKKDKKQKGFFSTLFGTKEE
jgi:hypothetical protein